MLFLFLLSAVFAFTTTVNTYTPDEVMKLKGENDMVVVMFYATWCSHCKRFTPSFQQIANSFTDFPRIKFGRVNCVEYGQFCKKNYVFGYPSLSFFIPDKEIGVPYEGPRDAPHIVSYIAYILDIKTMVAVPVELVTPIATSQFFTLLEDHTQTSVVLVWRQTDSNTEAVEIMKHLAYLYLVDPSIQFHYLLYSEPSLSASLEITRFPSVVILSRGEVYQYEYEIENVGVTYLEDEDDDEDGEDSQSDDTQSEEIQEPKMLESGLLRLINAVTGNALNYQGSSVLLPGYDSSMVKLLKSVHTYDRETLNSIQKAIETISDSKLKKIYQSVYDMLLTKGSKGIWNEWRRVFEAVRKQEDSDQIAYMNILRLFAKSFDVEFENEEL